MSIIHLIEGPVGAGKSTFAAVLAWRTNGVQQDLGYVPFIHVLDAPIDVRRERVRRRNAEKGATFSMVVPDHVFEMASNLWEVPDEIECEEFEVQFVEPLQLTPTDGQPGGAGAAAR